MTEVRGISIYWLFQVFRYFPFGFEGRMWDLIASVPDHCFSFYLGSVAKSLFLNVRKFSSCITIEHFLRALLHRNSKRLSL